MVHDPELLRQVRHPITTTYFRLRFHGCPARHDQQQVETLRCFLLHSCVAALPDLRFQE